VERQLLGDDLTVNVRATVYAETRRRAARALVRYLEDASHENARELLQACEAMRVARLALTPSQRGYAERLRRRVAA
jgi:hypothetical protein